jgi:hypothetical protein
MKDFFILLFISFAIVGALDALTIVAEKRKKR